MEHRGPDASGTFIEDRVGLGHRRLSIIDTSEQANQPMMDASGRFVIVFNGEIYNFRDLAGKWKKNWRTHSDTEVILEAFNRLREDFPRCLNGMFAMALYDRQQKELFLYRDRLGIKPLYYYFDEKVLIFASEIKVLKAFSVVPCEVEYDSLGTYLHLGYIPEPGTLYKGIRQLRAGHWMKFSGEGMEERPYWQATDCIQEKTISQGAEALDSLQSLAEDAVRSHLVCDVPFGTFLSGGVDSSLVTAIASKHYSGRLKTFSIGFTDMMFDESVHAGRVASRLGTEHHTFRVTEKHALELVDEATGLFDQPFADSSAIPTLLVSKLASPEVKMVLTGDGGDELFMGYGAYRWAERLDHPAWRIPGRLLSGLMKKGNSRWKRIGEMFDMDGNTCLPAHIFSQEQYLFSGKQVEKLLNPEYGYWKYPGFPDYDTGRRLTPAEGQALFDLCYYLRDDLLVKVDRASMKASLECRVPLLDYRLVEWSLNLDPSLKLRKGEGKYLLKQLLYRYLPSELFERPKRGFAVPMASWLKGPLKDLTGEYLSEEKVRQTNYLNFEEVKTLLQRFSEGSSDYLYQRIWALIVLQKVLTSI